MKINNKMVKIKLSKKEIEEIIKEKFNVNEVTWEGNNIELELDLDNLNKKVITRFVPYQINPCPNPSITPIWIKPNTSTFPQPYTRIRTITNTPSTQKEYGTITGGILL